MPFEYKDHEADVGIVGIGSTLGEAFEEGAKAVFNIMVDIEKVEPKQEISVECSATGLPELFVEWLNELLSRKDLDGLMFSKFEVDVDLEKTTLSGKAWGEPLDKEKHGVKIEVKGATYSGLKYEEKEGKHYLQCVVDV